ncbi:hypothetical protein TrVE_jg13471 [Triparma verrucosa]|uniref:PA domain-containing protein n=1 Tax=Triparma verrucosa TaxID=1606542 RepID=A0A9W7KSF3_9STRA|nr:hypothetical protein TrVE_jg13471 [Triparma verrucosa]
MSTPSIRGFVLAFFLFAFVPSLSISNLVAGQVHEEEVQPVYMSLHSKQTRRNQHKGLMTVEICKNCVDPSSEGSHIEGLNAYQGPQDFAVQSEIVYAIPNDGSRAPMNRGQLEGKIALFDRGTVALVEKVLHAQNAGALGVVLIDDGTCTDEKFTHCGMAGRLSDGGFARNDMFDKWKNVKIPALFITEMSGQRILNLMHLESIHIPGYGDHWKNV